MRRLGVTVLTAAALVVCAGSSNAASSKGAPSTTVIGVISSTSGPYSAVGQAYVKGVQLAASVWQKQHPKDMVKVYYEDDGYNPVKALSAYQKLTGINHINALINMSSPSIDAIYTKAKQANLPIAQGGEQGIPPTNDNAFQLLPGNIATEIALGKYVKSKGYKKVAVFYANSGVYVRFVAGFVKGFGGSVDEYGIAVDSTDYGSEVTKALGSNPDAVVFIDTPVQGANLVKQFAQQSTKKIPFFFDADIQTGFADYQKTLGDTSILNGQVAVVIRSKLNAAFVKAYKAKFGGAPYVGTDWAYDSFMLLMRTKSASRTKWIANIRKANFNGAGGKVVFDATGVRIPDFTIAPIANGELPK
jgi:ABC-type branched-subunit amino acid transport system substrate-binding protein